jgi:hypothetical protein
MISKKTLTELVEVARDSATWIYKNADQAESAEIRKRLWNVIKRAQSELDEDRSGYLLLIENDKKGRRITATVAGPDNYLSRTGWEAAGVEMEIKYSREVKDIGSARDELKRRCRSEKFEAGGMGWTQTPATDLRAVIDSIANAG